MSPNTLAFLIMAWAAIGTTALALTGYPAIAGAFLAVHFVIAVWALADDVE